MSGLGIQISANDMATPMIAKMREMYSGRSLSARLAPGINNVFSTYFKQLADARHHDGAPHNFYAEAAKLTTATPSPEGVRVSIAKQGIAQRYFGGTIVPIKGKFLAIPANAETYGTSPREKRYDGQLQFVAEQNGGAMLVQRLHSTLVGAGKRQLKAPRGEAAAKNRERGGQVMFWLVRSVTQKPDHTVLPPAETIQSSIILGLREMTARLKAEGNSAA